MYHHIQHSLSLEDFMGHNPPKFNQRVDSDKYLEDRKLSYVIYMLTGEVELNICWKVEGRMLPWITSK